MLIIITVILIIFVILEKQDEQAGRLEDSGKGGYRRLSIWVSEDGKGKDRSRLTRVILDRHWGRKEASGEAEAPTLKVACHMEPDAGLQGYYQHLCLDTICRS